MEICALFRPRARGPFALGLFFALATAAVQAQSSYSLQWLPGTSAESYGISPKGSKVVGSAVTQGGKTAAEWNADP